MSAIIRDLKDPRLPQMVSVVSVRVTKDLKFAKANISVMGDEKNMSDAGCNKWGHDGGHSVVEFVVNKSMWYHTGKTVTRFHPEWAKSRVVKAVNLGKNHLR